MQEITIVTENKVGILADICELLGGSGVNIEAISAQALGDSGLIRVVTSDVNTANRVLTKSGHKFKTSDIIVVDMVDRPGELAKIARKIAKSGVNVESLYILTKNKNGLTSVAIKSDNLAATMGAIK